jgi:hypothetical protein
MWNAGSGRHRGDVRAALFDCQPARHQTVIDITQEQHEPYGGHNTPEHNFRGHLYDAE